MRKCEIKKRYCLNDGKFRKENIYGEGIITDTIQKTMKDVAKTGLKKLATTVAEKTGQYAGDKIVDFLRTRKKSNKLLRNKSNSSSINQQRPKQLSQYEINERVNNLLSK